jgi:hypothetical protein
VDVKLGIYIKGIVPKRNEETGTWRKLHNEDDHIKKGDMGEVCSMHGRDEECMKNFV